MSNAIPVIIGYLDEDGAFITIDSENPLPTFGTSGGGGSVPVENQDVTVTNQPANYPLPASQVTALTPPTTVNVSDNGGSITVDGSVSVGNLPASYPLPADQVTSLTPPATQAVTQSGTWAVSTMANLSNSSASLLAYRNAALSNTPSAVKTATARMHYFDVYNPNSAVVFVHFYATAVANVTVGTTTPLWSMAIPAGASRSDYFVSSIGFASALTIACSTTATGNTAPTTPIVANIGYI